MLIIICIIAIVLISQWRKFKSKAGKLLSEIPGENGLPLIGIAHQFFYNPVTFFYRARFISSKYQSNHKIYKFWILGNPVVWLYDPEDIELLLSSTKHITKGFVYGFVQKWLKEGLLTSTGAKWQTRRKILTPTFHFNILKQFSKIFIEQSNELVERLKSEVGKEETDLMPLMTHFTLTTLSETAMGLKMDNTIEGVEKYKNAIYALGQLIIDRVSKPWFHSDITYSFTKAKHEETDALNKLHSFTTNVIRARRDAFKKEGSIVECDDKDEDDESIGMKKRMAMLDLLLKAEEANQIDESGIREEVDTFMFEGHDTTTLSLTFTLMLLANHQDVQDRIVAELDEIFLGNDRPPTVEDLNNMSYMEMCIKEALRLYPSVPFISRNLTEDLHLKKYVIPAGTTCDLHIFDINRDPVIFKDPLKFDPDRFLPENTRKRHPYSFLSFSAGPRNCIGQRFALYEEKVALSTLLKKYKVEPVTRPDDIIFIADLVLRTRDPVKVKFVKRIRKSN